MEDRVLFWSLEYKIDLLILLLGRGMDFLSTWVATPNLALEGNPLMKKAGWKLGGLINVALVIVFSFSPSSSIMLCSTSLLVAGRNFQGAWLMRTMGEEGYREWFVGQMMQTKKTLFLLCLGGQTFPVLLLGACLVYFSYGVLVPTCIGLGMIGYAIAILFFTILSIWRIRKLMA
ncbi:MAG: hypothetical protein JWN25_2153 [Verrucomicrobiales bacterium]|nr:hypothetical protein [Verrucomicrobiales bacterium]